ARRVRRGPYDRRRRRLRDRDHRQGHHLHSDDDGRRHDLLVVLRPQVPGRDGAPAGAPHDLQHVRRARHRARVGQGPPTELHAAPTRPRDPTLARPAGGGVIEARQLTKHFGPAVAVDHASFRVERGSVTGFLGPNGAGKTTTLPMLAGVFPPTGGQALVDGLDVARAPLAARRRVGYAPEHPALTPDATVTSLLTFVGAMRDVGGPAARRAATAKALERTGLTSVARRRI